MSKIKYEVRRPYMSGPTRWHEADVVATCDTLAEAERILASQRRGAARQGGYSEDAIVRVNMDGSEALATAGYDDEGNIVERWEHCG